MNNKRAPPGGSFCFNTLVLSIISTSRKSNCKVPENRGAGVARTPVFGLLLFRDLLIMNDYMRSFNSVATASKTASAS